MSVSCLRPLALPVVVSLVFIASGPSLLAAQTPEEEVRAVIDRLFDGMRAGDSTAVRSVFHEDVVMATTFTREGRPVMQEGSVDRFVTAVGTPHDEVWDERISEVEIRVDDNLASAWMNYAFHLGPQPHHCGVNSFQLFRSEAGWKIVYLVDTRRECGTN